MNITTVTPPATEPVTLAETKLFLKVDTDNDDALVEQLISASRGVAEDYTGRAFISQTLKASYDLEDLLELGDRVELPRPPIASVTSIKSYDSEDVEVEMDAADYRLSGDRIVLTAAGEWPGDLREDDCIAVVYMAGYGDAVNVPGPIKLAILRTVATHYENREDETLGTVVARLSEDAKALLDPYRVVGL